MRVNAVENALLSVTVSPWLRPLIKLIDKECAKDGSLLLNSLRHFLGTPTTLCPSCQHISGKIAGPVYALGSRFLRSDKAFMISQFIDDEYGEAWFRGFGLMMRGVGKYGVRVPFTPAGPFEIVWNLTYKCNLKCKHCYENAGGRNRPELSTDEAKDTLDTLSRMAGAGLPALSLSGGEPLARNDFFELAAYAKKRVPYVSIASNGTLITEKNAERIKDASVDYVEISVDGATPKVHDDFRGISGAFTQAMEGVKNCVEVGLDTCIATVLHRDNVAQLDGIIDLAKQSGARLMHFNYIPTGRAKAYVELDLTPEERLKVLDKIGRETVDLYLRSKEEELKQGKSSTATDRFFST